MDLKSPPTRSRAPAFFCAPKIRRSHALTFAHVDRQQPRALLRRSALHPEIVQASEWSLPSICLRAIALRWGRRACARWLAPPASRLPPPCRAGLIPHRALYPSIRSIAPTARAHNHIALLTEHGRGHLVQLQYAKATQTKCQQHRRASGARISPQSFVANTLSLRTPRSADAR